MIKANGIKITPTMFSDGTSQVWKLPKECFSSTVTINWEFEAEAEFMHLAQLVTLLRREVISLEIILAMDYLPYARQDKTVSNETTFALQTFASLLNTLDIDYVYSLDAHSIIPEYLIKNFHSRSPRIELIELTDKLKPDVFIFPDKGAKDRYSKDLAFLGKPHLYCDKIRNQTTGVIEGITVNGDIKADKYLIVDDICDGGATFIGVAKELYRREAAEVYLYVSHGIFSKGLAPLKEAGIKKIFTSKGEVHS